jgi:HAD superfamily hydrolase (TIGR01662 family)
MIGRSFSLEILVSINHEGENMSEQQLPALTGTEKQIKWAEDIRKRCVLEMQPAFDVTPAYRQPFERILTRQPYTTAKWWIDHRDDNLVRDFLMDLPVETARQAKSDAIKPELIIFDMNGTLTNTPFIDKQPLAVLPDRKEILASFLEEGIKLALVTNQGGVAFGFTTEEEATQEVQAIAQELGIEFFAVCFAHPKPKAGYERYGSPEMLSRRKPEAAMLVEAMEYYHVTDKAKVFMIGDMEDDKQAAKAANVRFFWADDFFQKLLSQHSN